MCLRRAPEKNIAGAALDRADVKGSGDNVQGSELIVFGIVDNGDNPRTQ
jgi:hypothetical protein